MAPEIIEYEWLLRLRLPAALAVVEAVQQETELRQRLKDALERGDDVAPLRVELIAAMRRSGHAKLAEADLEEKLNAARSAAEPIIHQHKRN